MMHAKPFDATLHVGAPNIGDRDKFHRYVDEMFDRRWLTNRGRLVQELEEKLADYLGVKHCITMCNGTVALEIAIRALDLKGEVILPSFTFIASAHALQWQGIRPVFCDIDPETYCIDPREVEKHVRSETSAIMGVHLYGRPCDIEALQVIADKHRLSLLFDAAHAFGCSHKGQMIGRFGNCEVFSFHATKVFNTFEGGAISTNDDALAERIRLMQNFGFRGMDNVVYLGINGKMTEVCAAMGLCNLDALRKFIAVNERNYFAYRDRLTKCRGLFLIDYNKTEKANWQYVVVEVAERYPLTRDALMNKLHAHGVRARRYFWPGCHRMEPYRSLLSGEEVKLPVTEAVSDRILVLPTGTSVNEAIVNNIVSLLPNVP